MDAEGATGLVDGAAVVRDAFIALVAIADDDKAAIIDVVGIRPQLHQGVTADVQGSRAGRALAPELRPMERLPPARFSWPVPPML